MPLGSKENAGFSSTMGCMPNNTPNKGTTMVSEKSEKITDSTSKRITNAVRPLYTEIIFTTRRKLLMGQIYLVR
jgi:hypothetical protein